VENTAVWLLILGYVLIGALLLIICVKSRLSGLYKVSLILLTTSFFFVVYLTMPKILGWPVARDILPNHFKLVSSIIYEPNGAVGDQGMIYLWAIDAQRARRNTATPRSYALPYKKDLHKKLVEAQNKVKKGIGQLGEVTSLEADETSTKLGQAQARNESIAINFYDLPDPLVPAK
jgi:hypothetical protein